MPRWRSESASVRSINGVARANNGGSALAASICPAPALPLRSNSTALARDAILASGQTLRCPNEGWQSLSNHDEHATTAAYRVVVLSLNQRGCPPRFNERTTDWHRPQPIDLPCPAAPPLARRPPIRIESSRSAPLRSNRGSRFADEFLFGNVSRGHTSKA